MQSRKRSGIGVHEGGGSAPKKRAGAGQRSYRDCFNSSLFGDKTLKRYQKQYDISSPYKHGVISDLIEPSLLRSVREEIQENLSFTPKETDIYKIHQSGDLANLDGLDDSSLERLPSLLTLRNALYSPAFRSYLSAITAAGPLSGKKTDMAINVYTPGCHLLCHDDVVGSRRVSYILYLTDPDVPWMSDWGGALRLYPTKTYKKAGLVTKVPLPDPVVSLLPAWNQLSFFAVQPGESFHDVEEVFGSKFETENQKHVRMAISGWYHIPQRGEDGFQIGLEQRLAATSSLTQLQSKDTEHDLPQPHPKPYPVQEARRLSDEGSPAKVPETSSEGPNDADTQAESEEDILTEVEIDFLLKYVSPTYLTPDTIQDLKDAFNDASFLRIDEFLNKNYAETLRRFIEEQPATLPDQTKDVQAESHGQWTVACPPHKHRYLYMLPSVPDPDAQSLIAVVRKEVSPLKEILSTLLPSLAFRKWLQLATDLKIASHDIRTRRFRRGNDYSLATAYEEENPRLELTLVITPSGGWEEDDDDNDKQNAKLKTGVTDPKAKAEAVDSNVKAEGVDTYDTQNRAKSGKKSSKNGKEKEADAKTQDQEVEDSVGGYEAYMSSDPLPSSGGDASDPAVYQSVPDEEDDGILLSMAAGWNRLSLVLRDKGVMKFVKYVSAKAEGDRWDVVGEFGVEPEDDDDADSQEDDGNSEQNDKETVEGAGEPEASSDSDDDDESTTDLAEAAEQELDSESS
ncbi:hypothetical protein MMC30_003370 [Trapelia coarctata]|nr:hypothetical protein [Trapelia coarctata]